MLACCCTHAPDPVVCRYVDICAVVCDMSSRLQATEQSLSKGALLNRHGLKQSPRVS
jgi:hypothetical protein